MCNELFIFWMTASKLRPGLWPFTISCHFRYQEGYNNITITITWSQSAIILLSVCSWMSSGCNPFFLLFSLFFNLLSWPSLIGEALLKSQSAPFCWNNSLLLQLSLSLSSSTISCALSEIALVTSHIYNSFSAHCCLLFEHLKIAFHIASSQHFLTKNIRSLRHSLRVATFFFRLE